MIEETKAEMKKVERRSAKSHRRPISEYKVIQNVAPLTDDKSRLREWNRMFVNAMGQVERQYETALTMIMQWSDADSIVDMEKWQTVTDRVMTRVGDFDTDQFEQDLKNVLIEKSVGTVHTKVNNGLKKGGVYIYVDIYKLFTETSGLGLTAQARKLMQPEPAKNEQELTNRLEDWTQKCDRLAEFELQPRYKTAALECLVVGESKRLFEVWKLEGLTFDKIMAKLKEYARGRRLNEDANKGKQAVDMNWFPEGDEGEDKEIGEEEDPRDLNKVSQLKCSVCKITGHTAAQCWKAKAKGKGKDGPKGKGKGKEGGGGGKGKGKSGPKGGCYNCGSDHFASNCPKADKGDTHQVFTFCSVTDTPLRNRYEELSAEASDTPTIDDPGVSSTRARTVGPSGRHQSRESVFAELQTSLSDEPKEPQLVDKPPPLIDSDDENQAWRTQKTRKQKWRWKHVSMNGTLRDYACGSECGCAKSLIEMSKETAHAVGEIPEWEELDMMVDSGASVTVINEDMVRAVTASDAKPNVKYEVADGSLIDSMGQKTCMAVTGTGVTNQMTAQVTEVKKNATERS